MAGSGYSSWKELPHACGALCLRSASVILIESHNHRPLQSDRITFVPNQQPTPPLQLQLVARCPTCMESRSPVLRPLVYLTGHVLYVALATHPGSAWFVSIEEGERHSGFAFSSEVCDLHAMQCCFAGGAGCAPGQRLVSFCRGEDVAADASRQGAGVAAS